MKRKNNLDSISIQSFVEYYLGTRHSCSRLKHQGLKSFDNPYLIGVSNDFALNNPDYVVKNELVIVIDDYGNPGTYVNPYSIKKLIELETCREKLKLIEDISCHNFEEVSFLYQIWNKLCLDVKCLEGLNEEEVLEYDISGEEVNDNENIIVASDPLEEYQVTEKINRQKRLNNNRRVS